RQTPTPAADEVVIAPRILENTPVATAPRPTNTHVPTRAAAVLPTQTPAAIPTAPVSTPTPPPFLMPNGKPLTQRMLRRWIGDWTRFSMERRAHAAVRVAYASRYWIRTHPDEPFSAELKQMLPRNLKDDANTAESNRRPALAMEFLVAYLQLN